ncbi:peptidoglycan DD-metalloendopeptidase family protein [Thermoleptolyngbya sp. M55_K2018_002]|uniref:peptidoglycan DD-metalloendopeptidase family protein n=1 Tax=Thermoleptolyngbya sp. M55_K2018_002 TaxID=2747808 RepID=UPI0025DB73C5|nr:peptidoglycan DD-metalloendopeptidase family protein [Thermoleptolyngbya sp. M55_K2018_002]
MDSTEVTAAVRAALREEIKPLAKRLDQLERTHRKAAKSQSDTLGSIKESVIWNDLIVDAALCGICLSLLLGVAVWEAGRDKLCNDAPGWARAAIPFCGSNAAAPALSAEDAKVMAFLDLIAWAEGTGDRYDIQFTGTSFTGDTHPRQIRCSEGLCSDAAGRYQFLSTTWDGLGLPDFSPANQDKGAIALLKSSGAYDLILSGDIDGAVCKAGPVWASLPCNDYNQPQKSTADLKAKYAEFLEKRKAAAPKSGNSSGWIHPVPSATLTSGFGWRDHPIERYRHCHYGIDLGAPTGTPILAAKAGEVVGAGDAGDGYGYKVVLHHADGSKSLYAHHSKNLVSKGQTVNQGEAIALLGSTGNSSGPHLHLEITDTSGLVIDPKPHIPDVKGPQSFGSIDPTKSAQCMDKRL